MLKVRKILYLVSRNVRSCFIDEHFEHQRFNMWWCHSATTITISCIPSIQLCLQYRFLQTVKRPMTDTAAKSQGDKRPSTEKDGGWAQEGAAGGNPGRADSRMELELYK